MRVQPMSKPLDLAFLQSDRPDLQQRQACRSDGGAIRAGTLAEVRIGGRVGPWKRQRPLHARFGGPAGAGAWDRDGLERSRAAGHAPQHLKT